MRIYIFILSILALTGISPDITAQYENVWAFGYGAGIDFNYNPPKAIKTSISSNEACASIADVNGQLLFYTDGTTLWNRLHTSMPSTIYTPSTFGTTSSAQGALIIPVPGYLTRYYVFSIISQEDDNRGQLFYSIVDLTLNNGLGDIVPGNNGVPLDNRGVLTEHMTAVAGNNCDIWLIVLSRLHKGEFLCFNISTNGINYTPVISKTIPSQFNGQTQNVGYMDVSPDRTQIAIARGSVQLYSFNPSTGTISDPVALLDYSAGPYISNSYGIAFSPDGSKIYTFARDQWGSPLYQFDLSAGDSLTIVNSKTKISQGTEVAWNSFNALKRAPDGKIYLTANGTTVPGRSNIALSIIHRPNLAGNACNFEPYGFTLFPGSTFWGGLPNINSGIFEHYKKNGSFSLACNADTLKALNSSGYGYLWNDGIRGAERAADSEGIYWVRYQAMGTQCVEEYVDTFKLLHQQWKQTTSSSHIEACWNDTVHIAASYPGKANYIWQDLQTGSERAVTHFGIFWVKYHEPGEECNNYADSFYIQIPEENYSISFLVDTMVCQGFPLNITNRSPEYYNHITWHFGNGDSTHTWQPGYTYHLAGKYNILLTGSHNGICADTAYATVTVDTNLTTYFEHSPREICAGQDISFTHLLVDSSIVNLYWTLDNGIFAAITDTMFIHHYEQSGIKYITLNAQFRACPAGTYIDSVLVHPLPLVDLGSDSVICLKGAAVTLQNRYTGGEGYTYLWSTGATTKSIHVKQEGEYHLQLSNIFGCTAQEHIIVNKNCYTDIPNVFTPNGDGVNDYFFPKQLLSKGFTGFYMQILNRWGEKIFETTSMNGRGWDGRFNGQEQPSGTYIYIIETILKNGSTEQYNGNVTLLR